MIARISGTITEITPNYVIIECHGIGYQIHISLQTYSKIQHLKETTLHTQLIVREDAHLLYGFHEPEEKKIFNLLISISGIGPSTAMLMLSALSAHEIQQAIANSNLSLLKSIKGIGTKTAERIIVELKDKISSLPISAEHIIAPYNKSKEESLLALVGLGFNKNAADKVLTKLFADNPNLTTEEAIKASLKML